MTTFALKDQSIHGKPLKLEHTYTGKDTINLVEARRDIDLVLLDGVMETTDAGLSAAKYIRQQLNREIPIIVMRSGFAWDADTNLEIQANLDKFPYIDQFLLKTSTTKQVLVDTLNRWLQR